MASTRTQCLLVRVPLLAFALWDVYSTRADEVRPPTASPEVAHAFSTRLMRKPDMRPHSDGFSGSLVQLGDTDHGFAFVSNSTKVRANASPQTYSQNISVCLWQKCKFTGGVVCFDANKKCANVEDQANLDGQAKALVVGSGYRLTLYKEPDCSEDGEVKHVQHTGHHGMHGKACTDKKFQFKSFSVCRLERTDDWWDCSSDDENAS